MRSNFQNPTTIEAATQTTENVEDSEKQAVDKSEESTTKVTEEVSDEFCSNKEYGEAFKVNESDDTITYDIECWDPGNKWIKEDVFNHMGESLEQMFRVFKIKPEDQKYQLDVFEKVNDTFNLKLEMKKFANNKAVIDNFRRQGHVPGGCCVKFYRKLL